MQNSLTVLDYILSEIHLQISTPLKDFVFNYEDEGDSTILSMVKNNLLLEHRRQKRYLKLSDNSQFSNSKEYKEVIKWVLDRYYNFDTAEFSLKFKGNFGNTTKTDEVKKEFIIPRTFDIFVGDLGVLVRDIKYYKMLLWLDDRIQNIEGSKLEEDKYAHIFMNTGYEIFKEYSQRYLSDTDSPTKWSALYHVMFDMRLIRITCNLKTYKNTIPDLTENRVTIPKGKYSYEISIKTLDKVENKLKGIIKEYT